MNDNDVAESQSKIICETALAANPNCELRGNDLVDEPRTEQEAHPEEEKEEKKEDSEEEAQEDESENQMAASDAVDREVLDLIGEEDEEGDSTVIDPVQVQPHRQHQDHDNCCCIIF